MEGEREGEKHVWLPPTRPHLGTRPATQACALTRKRTHDPLVHRPLLNPLSYTSQGKNFFLIKGHTLVMKQTYMNLILGMFLLL